MKIKLSFAGNSIETEQVAAGSRLSCIKSNNDFASFLGFDPDAVTFMLNGSMVSGDPVLSEGDVISVAQRAHEKAA